MLGISPSFSFVTDESNGKPWSPWINLFSIANLLLIMKYYISIFFNNLFILKPYGIIFQ
tara:strand:- start:96 stop:272 length:177 start_codon:yes stop_codon:yes gene_type:complete